MTSRPRVAAQHTFKHAAPTYSETTPVSYPGIDPNPAIRGRFPRQTHQSARNNPGLGIRVSALQRAVEEDRDPYLAVAALRSAIAIAGREELRGWLQQLAHSESFMVREEAQRTLT